MRPEIQTLGVVLLLAAYCPAAHLSSPARLAFEDYTATVENRLAQQHSSPDSYVAVFNLGPAERTDAERQWRSGAVRVEPGLAWLIMPIVQEMPQESLKFTLAATRNALQSSAVRKAH